MKLKRFLLRYDPPGVGLEVEADDEVTVQHKNLPPQDDVSSKEEVKTLVDQIIESENVLLTRRRHRSALIQLICRLYQVTDEGEEEAPPGKTIEDDAGSPTGADVTTEILEGQELVLAGLSGKQQVHNGEIIVVTKARSDKQKYEVRLATGEELKVKGSEHLLRVSDSTALGVGVFVAIRGLRNHIELNGCIARVAECHEESMRFEVRAWESGQLFRVKAENLVLIKPPPDILAAASAAAKENREPNSNNTPRKKEGGLPAAASEAPLNPGGDAGDSMLEVGSAVELTGLKTAQAYNGQQAEVLSVDRVRSRYEIRLGDGSVKTIRAENVRLIGGKSPRAKRPKDKS